tara:strand:+ start:188 stop:1399 length:1212 start_codon:yes stop_codon:yes gene_type:complete
MELLTEAAGKNLHLEHLEDEILNFGIAGGRSSIMFLQSLRDMFAGSSKTKLNVTVKWDGAPAVFAGPHPETGKFFVATKSLFRKRKADEAYYHTNSDIDRDKSGELANKLKVCLAEFPKLGMKEILQGDLMFTDDVTVKDIDGEAHYTFTPNTIMYAVPVNSKIGQEINKAKVGIVWHTTYKGDSIENLKASFGAKTPGKSSRVWQDDATYKDVSGKAKMTASDTVKLNKLLSAAGKQFQKINSGQFNAFLRWQDSLGSSASGAGFKTYLNTYTRAGKRLPPSGKVMQMYFKHFNDWWLKNKGDSPTAQSNLKRHLSEIRKATNALKNVVDFINFLVQAKMMIVKQLDSAKGIAKTFVKTDNGFKVVNPEGYVAIDKSGGAVKIVDKLEFSFNNFTVAKNWDK